MPRIRSNVKALMPWSVKPSRRMPSTHAPMNAPITVPLPPASSVPPMTAAEIAWNMIPAPPASGSVVVIRTASMIPAKPASVLASMKLRTFVQRTRMPASREPRRFPPTANVCSPQRVRISTSWSTSAMPIAHRIPE